MSRCEYHALLGAYHDGELPADRATALEGHLSACADCGPELERMRGLSEQLQTAERPKLRPMDKARLRETVAQAADRVVSPAARRARWLTAAAAALFFVSMTQIVLMHYHNDPTSGQNQLINPVVDPTQRQQKSREVNPAGTLPSDRESGNQAPASDPR